MLKLKTNYNSYKQLIKLLVKKLKFLTIFCFLAMVLNNTNTYANSHSTSNPTKVSSKKNTELKKTDTTSKKDDKHQKHDDHEHDHEHEHEHHHSTDHTKHQDTTQTKTHSEAKDKKTKKDDHHELHHAHKHSVAELKVAVDKSNKLKVELHVPMDSLIGFEHKPVSDKEKALHDEAKKKLVPSKLFSTDNSLKCLKQLSKLEFNYQDDHAEAHLVADYSCENLTTDDKSKKDKKHLLIKISKHFPKVKLVNITYVDASGKALKLESKDTEYKLELKVN